MRCDKCGGRKPTQKVVGKDEESGLINWCEECIEESEGVKMVPIREDGKLMVVDAEDVSGYGDYSVKYVDSMADVGDDERVLREVEIIDREILEGEI